MWRTKLQLIMLVSFCLLAAPAVSGQDNEPQAASAEKQLATTFLNQRLCSIKEIQREKGELVQSSMLVQQIEADTVADDGIISAEIDEGPWMDPSVKYSLRVDHAKDKL